MEMKALAWKMCTREPDCQWESSPTLVKARVICRVICTPCLAMLSSITIVLYLHIIVHVAKVLAEIAAHTHNTIVRTAKVRLLHLQHYQMAPTTLGRQIFLCLHAPALLPSSLVAISHDGDRSCSHLKGMRSNLNRLCPAEMVLEGLFYHPCS